MENRTKFFGMSIQERDAFFAREDVKNFLSEERTCMKEQLVEDIVECVRVDLMEGYLMDLYNANSDEDREFVGDFDSVFNGFLESETYKQLKDVNTLMFLRGSDYIFGQYLREIGKEHLIPTYVK